MLGRLLGQLGELGDRRRARAHPPGLRGGRARGGRRPRAGVSPGVGGDLRAIADAAAERGAGLVILPGRGRHPPRGARRPAQGPARRHGHAARRRLALARVRLPGALQARARDQRRLALPRRPPPHERVPRRAQGRRRRPARAGRRVRAARRAGRRAARRSGGTELARKSDMWRGGLWRAAQRGDEEARRGRGRGRARRRRSTTRPVRRRARARRTWCSRPRTRRGCARSVAAAPEDSVGAGARRARALGHPRRRQPAAAALLGAPAVGRAPPPRPRCGSATTTRTRSCSTRP